MLKSFTESGKEGGGMKKRKLLGCNRKEGRRKWCGCGDATLQQAV